MDQASNQCKKHESSAIDCDDPSPQVISGNKFEVDSDQFCTWSLSDIPKKLSQQKASLAQTKGHCIWKMDKDSNKCKKDEEASALDCDDPSPVVVSEKKFVVDSDQFCSWSALDVTKLHKQTTSLAQVGGHCIWKRDSPSGHCYKDVEASAALADCEDPSPNTVQLGAFETDIDLKCTWS